MTRTGPTKKVDPEQVAQLAADGLGRNAVARQLGVSRRAVDEAARAAGVSWVRTATAAATAARLTDVRAELADTFATTADLAGDRLIDALQDDQLDPAILRALATVAGISADKLIALGDRVNTTDDTGDDLLTRLSAGVASWAEALSGTTDHEHTTTDAQEAV